METPSQRTWNVTDLTAAFDALGLDLQQAENPSPPPTLFPQPLTLPQAGARGGLFEQTLSLRQAEDIASATGAPLRVVEGFALKRGLIPARYAPNVGTFTAQGQEKLLRSKVVVVGLGGLGGYVVEQLARAGVGQITGVDPDTFEEQNLNRQILGTVNNLGHKKIAEAGRRLRQVNPAVEFVGHDVAFQQLADDIFQEVKLVFDCLDTGQDRIELAERCSALNLPLVHGAIGGWFGQVGMCWPGTNLIPRLYRSQARGVEREMGNPPFTPALAASLMVAKGLRFLLGILPPPEASLHFFDLLAEEWETIGS
jgi:molybdopterin/thiamine biosynthesis adenylyltransferase